MNMHIATAALDAGYLHGLATGSAVGGVLGIVLGLLIAALLHASAGEPPAPTSRISLVPTFGDEPERAEYEQVESAPPRRPHRRPRGAT